MLKTNIFEKKAISPVKKRLWPISSRIIEHDKRQRTTCKGPQGNLTINVEVRWPFLQDPTGCWIHKFLKRKATFPVKNRFSPISSRITEHVERRGTSYRGPQGNLTNNVEVIRPFLHDPRCCCKHKFLKKKAIFSVKRFCPTPSRIIVHDKLPETTYKGPQGNLTINVEVKRSFLQDPRGCWIHKFLKKKATFPVKNRFSPFSSRITEHDERRATSYRGPQGNLTNNVEVKRSFLQDPRGCWIHKFLKKKATFPVKNRFSPISSRITDHDKLRGTSYRGPQGNLTINVEVKRSLLQDPRGSWKHKFLKKRQPFQWRKDFNLFFLALSSVINLKGHIKKFQKGLR